MTVPPRGGLWFGIKPCAANANLGGPLSKVYFFKAASAEKNYLFRTLPFNATLVSGNLSTAACNSECYFAWSWMLIPSWAASAAWRGEYCLRVARLVYLTMLSPELLCVPVLCLVFHSSVGATSQQHTLFKFRYLYPSALTLDSRFILLPINAYSRTRRRQFILPYYFVSFRA